MRHPAPSWVLLLALTLAAATPVAAHAQGGDPLTPEEEVSLEEIRAFVQATATRYRMLAPLEVSVASWVGSGSLPQYAAAPAVYTRGALYVSRRLLRASNRDLVIAKALAYELLRAPSKATSLAERERERTALSLESNARAVAILVEVGGLTEEAALEEMYAWLIAIHRAAGGARRAAPPGGVSACDEIADLLRRHPGASERFAGRECAPP
jgi:prophage DNA circulation protein